MPGLQTMIYGLVIAAIGLVVTLATYSAASPGGHYVIAWGAILIGGVRFLQGLVALLGSAGRRA